MLHPAFTEDLMFEDLGVYKMQIEQKKVDEFMCLISDDELPDNFKIELPELTFTVSQKKKELRILSRNYNYISTKYIDACVYTVYMTAIKSGFTAYLENKFNN